MTTTLRAPRARVRSDAIGWLTIYVALLFFIPSRLVLGPLGSAGAPSMLFGLGSMALWLFAYLGAARRVVHEPQPIRIALGIFLACVGISYTLAMTHPISSDEISPADVALLALLSWSGTLLLTHDAVYERRRLDTLVWRLVCFGGVIAALGLIQVFTRRLWVDLLSIQGLTNSGGYDLSSRGGYPRPVGTAIHPIEYGVILAVLFPLALHVGFHHTRRKPLVRWLPAAALCAILPLTSSRSAYLGAIIALVVCMFGWSRERQLRVLLVGVTGLLSMAVVAPNFVSSVSTLFTGAGDDPSVESRTDSVPLALEFLAQHPWFGRGLGTFLPKYRIFDNEYLLLLVSIGVVGTVAFIGLGLTAAVTLLRLRTAVRDEATRDLAQSLCAAVVTGFICLFMFDAFAFPMTMGVLFLTLGLAGALRRVEHENRLLEKIWL